MAMSVILRTYLAHKGIAYDILPHRHTDSSVDSALTAHIPVEKLAKSVVLEDENGYLMAVIPANERLQLRRLHKTLGRNVELATEHELEKLFTDCETGAVPAVGDAFGMETVVDTRLDLCSDVYIEAGDHEDLIHLKGVSFRKLMKDANHMALC